MEYNERIRGLREDKDMNQTELAKIIHSTQKTISNWEKGYSEPNIDMIKALAKFFNVTSDYILGLTDEPRPLKEIRRNEKNIQNININGGKNKIGNININ